MMRYRHLYMAIAAILMYACFSCFTIQVVLSQEIALKFQAGEQLEKQLQSELRSVDRKDNEPFGAIVLRTQSAQVIEQLNYATITEMIRFESCPLVGLVSFEVVLRKHPEDAFFFALKLLAKEPNTSLELYESPIKVLQSARTSEANTKEFRCFLEQIDSNAPQKLTVLLTLLNKDIIVTVMKGSIDRIAPSVAIACLRAVEDDFREQAWWKEKVESLRDVPGSPMLTYVRIANSTDPGFAERINYVLENEEALPLVLMICRKHRDWIRNAINVGGIKLSPERMDRVKKLLAQQPK